MSLSREWNVNGWLLCAHSVFLDQYEALVHEVSGLKKNNPNEYKSKNATKRLAAIQKLIFEIIPNDPTLSEYRQGVALGETHKHWFRAKFFQQYRLFFRFHKESKVIVYAWVNDIHTKRAYDSKTDAYKVFKKMLDNRRPPSDWHALLSESQQENDRFNKLR